MTKKDYELIATVLSEMQDKYDGSDWTVNGTIYLYAQNLATAIAKANPNFDYERFMEKANS
jgi:hypothetical protein